MMNEKIKTGYVCSFTHSNLGIHALLNDKYDPKNGGGYAVKNFNFNRGDHVKMIYQSIKMYEWHLVRVYVNNNIIHSFNLTDQIKASEQQRQQFEERTAQRVKEIRERNK